MAIRKMLVPLTGGNRDEGLLDTACRLAAQLGAHVDALFTRTPAVEAVPLVGEGVSAAVVDQLVNAAEREWSRREIDARRAFDAVQARTGMAVATTPQEAGKATLDLRIINSREDIGVRNLCPVYDLIVLPGVQEGPEALQVSLTLEAVLLSGGRPVLTIPEETPDRIGHHIAVAWSGDPHGARALSFALPMLQQAESITIFTVGDVEPGTPTAEEVVEYLTWHRLTATATVAPGNGRIGPAILTAATRSGADCLVMGGYGHSRVRELILGGATRHILGHAPLPVFMSH